MRLARAKDAARTTEQRRPSAQAYYRANRERILEERRATRARERELAKQRYAANPDRKKSAVAEWQKRNPASVKANGQRKRARKASAPTIPFSAAQLAQRCAYFGHLCWMCHAPATTIDHVKPLARGGWHALCNIRPACVSCNSRKHARWPFDG